jgi:hypothetical protein
VPDRSPPAGRSRGRFLGWLGRRGRWRLVQRRRHPAGGPGTTRSSFGGLRRKRTNASPPRSDRGRIDRRPPPGGPRPRRALAPLPSPRTARTEDRPAELAQLGDGRLVAAGVLAPTPRSRRRAALGRGALAAGGGPLRRHRVDVGLGPGVGLRPLSLGPPVAFGWAFWAVGPSSGRVVSAPERGSSGPRRPVHACRVRSRVARGCRTSRRTGRSPSQ